MTCPPALHQSVLTVLCAVLVTCAAATHAYCASEIERLPLQRDTELARAVILTPSSADYLAQGHALAHAINERTGLLLEVRAADDYVSAEPRAVKPDRLDRPFILLGQFWNNAVLERLYASMFDPTDALFPGPGGYEFRTVCSPFKAGHNCVVVTGSDLTGCQEAVRLLPSLLQSEGGAWRIPFLHRVQLGGEAVAIEAAYRERAAKMLSPLDQYAVFGAPDGKTWTGEDPRDFLVWKDRNLAAAATFGVRYWATGHEQDAQAFKRLVMGCLAELPRLEQSYREGRSDLVEYSLDGLTIAWDLIEETDAFTDAERQQITGYLYRLAELNRDAYFLYKCLDTPLDQVMFYNRHQIAGTLWMGLEGEYLQRNCRLDPDQQRQAQWWVANAEHYLKRLSQSYFYSDGVTLMHDEGGLVLRYALKTGQMGLVDSGNLRLLADYWVANHDNLGFVSSSGHNGNTRSQAQAGEVLNVADWLLPGEGYQQFRRQLRRLPYTPFLFYATYWAGFTFPYWNWETPATGAGVDRLPQRMGGVSVLPVGPGFDAYLRAHPDLFQGGYQRTPGRYAYDPVPYEQTWKRITLRSGFEKDDQYLVLDGLQGSEWSYDDINALVQYDDLGERLLKSQWDARSVQSRLEMNSLFVTNGTPGSRQSVAARLQAAYDGGPYALVASTAARHDGVAWTRRLFWQKHGWVVVADEANPMTDGDHYLVQTWLSWHPFTITANQATARAGEVTLHITGTPQRRFSLAEGGEGVRQEAWGHLEKGQPLSLWTMLSANSPKRPEQCEMRQIARQAALVSRSGGDAAGSDAAVLFSRDLTLGDLHIEAEMGVLTADRITLAQCRELTVGGRSALKPASGVSFAWDLSRNEFDQPDPGFGKEIGVEPPGLREERQAVSAAIARALETAAQTPAYDAPELAQAGPPDAPALTVTRRAKLQPPVNLVSGDLWGEGTEELALYDEQGRLRFPVPAYRGQPALVDFDGSKRRDIAFSVQDAVAVYRLDGTLRWQRSLSNPAVALCAGDLEGRGQQVLGLSQHNWGTVLNGAGEPVIDEEVFRYNGLGCAFGDVDGDGATEFVAVTTSGINVLRPNRTRQTVAFQSYFGVSPCRVWLRDLDHDGVPECYVGGADTDPACYDLRAMKCHWTLTPPLHPRDMALCDVDGDGEPEIIAGCADSFLYVLGRDGKHKFSRSAGGPVTSLARVSATGGDMLAVGLSTGHVMLLGQGLEPVGRAELVPAEPVTHVAALRGNDGRCSLVAAGASGTCAWLAIP